MGYIPTQSTDDTILSTTSDEPTKYMDYLFSRQSGSWYLTGLTDSETKPVASDSTAPVSEPEPLAESDVQDAILATTGDSAAESDAASEEAASQDAEAADETENGEADSTAADSAAASSENAAA